MSPSLRRHAGTRFDGVHAAPPARSLGRRGRSTTRDRRLASARRTIQRTIAHQRERTRQAAGTVQTQHGAPRRRTAHRGHQTRCGKPTRFDINAATQAAHRVRPRRQACGPLGATRNRRTPRRDETSVRAPDARTAKAPPLGERRVRLDPADCERSRQTSLSSTPDRHQVLLSFDNVARRLKRRQPTGQVRAVTHVR